MRKENPARFSSAVGEAWMHCEFKVKYCHKIFDEEIYREAMYVVLWGYDVEDKKLWVALLLKRAPVHAIGL